MIENNINTSLLVEPPLGLDLSARIDRHVVAERLIKERNDAQYIHGSDFGKCLRQVWARIHGQPLLPWTAPTLHRFTRGEIEEERMLAEVRHVLTGEGVVQMGGEFVGRFYFDDRWIEAVPAHLAKRELDIIAHPDAVVSFHNGETALIEIKSSSIWKLPDEPKPVMVWQAAAYAVMLKTTWFAVMICASGSGQHRFYWYDTTDFIEPVFSRAQTLLTLQSLVEIPAPRPPEPWMCDYCPLPTCEKNNNPDRKEYIPV